MSHDQGTSKSRQFLHELAQFYRNRGQLGYVFGITNSSILFILCNNVTFFNCSVTPKHLVARLDGRQVNLWDLYSTVLELGGSFKINQQSQWDLVYQKLYNSKPVGVNVSVALRQVYQRYLMPYEKVNCTNFTTDIAEDDDDSGLAVKDQPTSFVLHSSLSQPLGHQSISNSLSSNCMPDPMTRLLCALGSGLANEIDFGLKVVTMLTNSRQVDLVSDHRFVEALVECSSVGACDCDVDAKCSCVQQFWSSKCNNDTLRSLIFDQESEAESQTGDTDDFTLCPQIPSLSPEWIHQYSQRVKRIADLVRRIVEHIKDDIQPQDSLEDEIVTCEPASLSLVKFTALLLFTDDPEMVSIGLDIMTNIEISPRTQSPYCELRRLISLKLASFVLESTDIDLVTRSLDCLSQLATHSSEGFNRVAKDILTDALLERLIQLLTCQHDVHLVVASLEFCLAISQLHPKLLIQSNSYLVKILLNLVNCDASSHFSQNALSKIKVSDTRTRTQQLRTIICQQPTTRIITTNSVGQSVTLTVPGDNEVFVVNWLRSTYEASDPKSSIAINDLYAEYVKFSLKNNRRNVVGVPVFSQIVLKTFPRVSLINHRFDGIKCKITTITTTTTVQCKVLTPQLQQQLQQQQQQSQLQLQQQSQQPSQTHTQGLLTSPILKAHLSAPPKTSLTTTATTSTTPSTPSPSTLIKTLLATKLQSKNTVGVNSAGKDIDDKEEGSNSNATTVVTTPIQLPSAGSVPSSNPQTVLISTPSVTGAGQPTQQLILVRTVNHQGNIVGVPSGGQVRLILPASVLTQQRPLLQPTVNGAVNNVTLNHHISQSTAVSISNASQPVISSSPSASLTSINTPTTSTSNDILMKAVLGSGIVAENSNEPAKSSPVKSSPLLNVLLDKGKLPDNQNMSSPFTIPQQIHLQPNQPQQQNKQQILQQASFQPETQKMFILATKPAVSNSVVKNGTKETESDSLPLTLTNGDVSNSNDSCDRGTSGRKDLNSNTEPVSNVSNINNSNNNNNTQDASSKQLTNKRPNDETNKQDQETLNKKTKVESVDNEATFKSTANGEVNNFTKSNTEMETEVPKVSTTIPNSTSTTSNTNTNTNTNTITITTNTNTNTTSITTTNILPVRECAKPTAVVAASSTNTQPATVVPPPLEFVCEWVGCQK